MKKTLAWLLAGGLLAAAPAAPGLAAPNPAGTGQPGAECGDEGATMEPAGFLTAGFAHAETVCGKRRDAIPRTWELPRGLPVRHRLLSGDIEPLGHADKPGRAARGRAWSLSRGAEFVGGSRRDRSVFGTAIASTSMRYSGRANDSTPTSVSTAGFL